MIHFAARDVTERKLLDRKLRDAQRWESLRVLAGGIAHDFNNLLTAMMGNASLARGELAADIRGWPSCRTWSGRATVRRNWCA